MAINKRLKSSGVSVVLLINRVLLDALDWKHNTIVEMTIGPNGKSLIVKEAADQSPEAWIEKRKPGKERTKINNRERV